VPLGARQMRATWRSVGFRTRNTTGQDPAEKRRWTEALEKWVEAKLCDRARGSSACINVEVDILDEELLPERARELVRDDAGGDVGRPAGGERHHDRHRARSSAPARRQRRQ